MFVKFFDSENRPILGSDGTWFFNDCKKWSTVYNRLKKCVKPTIKAVRAGIFLGEYDPQTIAISQAIVEVNIKDIGINYAPDGIKYDENRRVFNGSREYFTDQNVRNLKRNAMEILIVYSIVENRLGKVNEFLSGKDLLYKKLSDNTWAVYRKS